MGSLEEGVLRITLTPDSPLEVNYLSSGLFAELQFRVLEGGYSELSYILEGSQLAPPRAEQGMSFGVGHPLEPLGVSLTR